MNGRTLLISGLAALAIAASPTVFAQTSGEGSDHHPADSSASQQPGSSGAQAQGVPMGPGMMMGPGQWGPGMMEGRGTAPNRMGYWGAAPGGMGYMGMGPGGMGYMGMGPGRMGHMGMGPGMMGGGMMYPGMMMGHHPHHEMMGHGMGHHGLMMGGWVHGRGLSLSADDVKRVVDGRLALRGLKHLKAGPVKIVDDATATADIVTKDGSLAVRLRVDRNTGFAVITE